MRLFACCIVAGTMLATSAGFSQQHAQQDASRAMLPVYAKPLPATEIFESDEILAATVDQIRRQILHALVRKQWNVLLIFVTVQ